MHLLLLLVTLVTLAWLGAASPVDPRRRLADQDPHMSARSIPSPQQIKGHRVPDKGGSPWTPPPPTPRKGEYVCGNRLCKLRPGEIPVGCNGVCQYRI